MPASTHRLRFRKVCQVVAGAGVGLVRLAMLYKPYHTIAGAVPCNK